MARQHTPLFAPLLCSCLSSCHSAAVNTNTTNTSNHSNRWPAGLQVCGRHDKVPEQHQPRHHRRAPGAAWHGSISDARCHPHSSNGWSCHCQGVWPWPPHAVKGPPICDLAVGTHRLMDVSFVQREGSGGLSKDGWWGCAAVLHILFVLIRGVC